MSEAMREALEMTAEEYSAAIADVIYLASCVVKDETPDKACAAGMDPERLYKAADRHQLTGVTACAPASATRPSRRPGQLSYRLTL